MKTLLMTAGATQIWWDGERIYFSTGMTVDGDGSPRCYGPHDSGLDYTANAGHPGNWFGVVTDKHGNPVVQGNTDPYPGLWVSQTSYQRPHFATSDPRKYLDSEKIRFMALPGAIRSKVGPVVLGCRSRATKGDLVSNGLCGDFGPNNHAGEASIIVDQDLLLNPGYTPKQIVRQGGTDHPILWEFWPGQLSDTQNGEDFPLIPA